jgi:APA family basic amino acid/polyamine antiporter
MNDDPTTTAPPDTSTGARSTGPSQALYARKATGLVRDVRLGDMMVFNAAAATPLGITLAFGLFYALVAFPRANLYIALVAALFLGSFVWVTFALMAAAMPKVGGDYVYNSRLLHPILGFGGNISMWASSVIAWAFWACAITTVGLGPAFGIVGVVTGHQWWLDASSSLASPGWVFGIALGSVIFLSFLSIIGTGVVARFMTIAYALAFVGVAISFVVLIITPHDTFVDKLNAFSQPITHDPNTYKATIATAHKEGLQLVSEQGYSVRSTIGAIFTCMGFTFWPLWGSYLAGEFRGAGRRQRQLTAMVGSGFGQGALIILGTFIFFHTIGQDFFAAANAGAYGVEVSPYFNFWVSIAAHGTFLAVLLAVLFLGWTFTACYPNLGMIQRAPFAWAFDGLIPRRFAQVSSRWHTPVFAIVVSGFLVAGVCVWVAWSSSFISVYSTLTIISFVGPFLVGIAALLMPWRHPRLYRNSAADWSIAGIPVLPVAGAGCLLASLFAMFLGIYFHKELGISNTWVAATLPLMALAVAAVYYPIARAVQRRRGVDLELVYKTIPPD